MNSHKKVIAYLKDNGPADCRTIAINCGMSEGHTQYAVKSLRNIAVLEVAEWKIEEGRKLNRRRALYGLTGKELVPTRWQSGNHKPVIDADRIETIAQAQAFAAALNGVRYDSEDEPRDVRRFDLARADAPTWSSLT